MKFQQISFLLILKALMDMNSTAVELHGGDSSDTSSEHEESAISSYAIVGIIFIILAPYIGGFLERVLRKYTIASHLLNSFAGVFPF